ncbi:protein-tyrosine-phosphatase [Malassezia sp. CBS 17886]|nr:protein-tyrosine-phosphatase [Malassezia sp. CBS 17886]
MSFRPPYLYIDAESLAKELKAADPGARQIAVVDVRDDDFDGGHIVGAIHAPSSNFSVDVDELVRGPLRNYSKVVFHCSLSQQRGPKAARIYRDTRDTAHANGSLGSGDTAPEQQLFVLRDGFANFGPKFKDDAALVTDWSSESWEFR